MWYFRVKEWCEILLHMYVSFMNFKLKVLMLLSPSPTNQRHVTQRSLLSVWFTMADQGKSKADVM